MATPFTNPQNGVPGMPGGGNQDPNAAYAYAQQMADIQNNATQQAGLNKNKALIGALPAYGTAEGQATSNSLNASQAARMASFQALLKAVGF